MKITLKENLSFINLYNLLKNTKLSLKTSFKLIQLNKQAQEHNEFYRNKFEDIINRYAKKDENGNVLMNENNTGIKIKEGEQEACIVELKELDQFEVELADIKFSFEEFETVNLSPEELDILLPFMDMDM